MPLPRPPRHPRIAVLASAALAALSHSLAAEDATVPPVTTPSAPAASSASGGDASQDTMIVTADRQSLPLKRSTASVDVVTQADDRLAGYQPFVFDWLRDLPGVNVYSSAGGWANTVSLSIRGSKEVKILQDGIPVDDPTSTNGSPAIELLSPAGLGRIEVVHGEQSGLYGSNAVGGVINLISIQPTDTAQERIRAEFGSFATAGGDAQATGPLNDWLGYAIGISALRSDGFSTQTAGNDGSTGGHPNDGFDRVDASVRLVAHDASGKDTAYLGLRTARSITQWDYLDISNNDNTVATDVSSWRASSGGQLILAEHLVAAADLAYSVIDRYYPNATTEDAINAAYDNAYGSPYSPSDQTFDSHETYASVRLSSDVIDHTVISIGADSTLQAVDITQVYGATDTDHGQDTSGAWGEVRWSVKALELSVTGRHDHYDDVGTANTYRLGAASFPLGDALKLFASTGSGFLAPSLFERYGQFVGNPTLQAQTSRSVEAGQTLQLPIPALTLTDTWFRTGYRNMIVFPYAYNPDGGSYANLASDSSIRGVENSLRWHADPFELAVSYTWQHSDDGTRMPLPLEPANRLSAVAILHGQAGWVRLGVERVWDRFIATYTNPQNEPPYTLLGAAAGVTLSRMWEVYVRGDNLTNAHYALYPQSTTEPRALFVGTTVAF
jgi:vitamin B12 transporter